MLVCNVVLEAIVQRVKLQKTGAIFNKQTQLIHCADDINIVGRKLEAVRDAYVALKGEAVKIGMKINKQNTKYMIAVRNRRILNAGQTVAFGDRNFEVFKELMYLGALVTSKNDVGLEKQRRN
jgi:hypothetical protein